MVQYHPQDEGKISERDIEEGRYAHRRVGHLAGKKGKAGVGDTNPIGDALEIMRDTPRGREMQTDVEIPTYEGKYYPSFGGLPLAGEGTKMVNPGAEIFRRGNPMEQAWSLLKMTPDEMEAEGFRAAAEQMRQMQAQEQQ